MSFDLTRETGKPVKIKDEGVTVTDSVSSLDMVGSGVTVTGVDDDITSTIPGGTSATWGSITGTLSNQTDLQDALDAATTLSGTEDEIAYFDSITTIASLPVSTYPTLGELAFVKGVTSAIQTQLDTKLGSTDVGSNLTVARIASSTFSTVQHMQDVFHSAGWVSGGGITDDTDGTITVALGTGLIRAINTATSEILFFDWAQEAGANVNLADNDINYVYVEYNNGSPQVVARTTESTDFNKDVLLAVISREGTTLHINETDRHEVGNHASNMVRRLKGVQPYGHVSGGILSAPATVKIAITAGTFWRGLTEFSTSSVNTNTGGTFSYYYKPAGAWTKVSAQTDIDNTQYNDFGTGLATLANNNRYGVHWVYLEADDDDVAIVYGIGDYTLTQAQDATAPAAVPQHLEVEGILAGKIIIKKNDSAFTQIESLVGVAKPSGSIATDHGNLAGLGDDDHSIYALLAGRSGGQILIGGTGTTDDLTLQTTSATGQAGADMHFLVGNAGGTEAITILNSGNVGISDPNPSQKLSVNGDAGISGIVFAGFNNDGTASAPNYAFLGDANTGMYSDTADTLAFSTGSTNAIYIDSSQRVGIGTDSPDATLEVIGTIFVEDGSVSAPSYSFTSDTGTGLFRISAGILGVSAGSTETVRFNGSQSMFHDGSASAPGITFLNDPNSGFFRATADQWGFSTGGAERMRLTNTGLGIGTTSPISPLEVEAGLTTVGAIFTLGTKEPTVVASDVLGRINFYAPLETGADAISVGASIVAQAEAEFTASVNATSLLFQTGASGVATTKMVINSAGDVAINTDARFLFDTISGNEYIHNNGSGKIRVVAGGGISAQFTNGQLEVFGNMIATDADGPAILGETSSTSNPTLIPDRTELGTGIGGTSNGLSLIAQGNQMMQFSGVQSAGGGFAAIQYLGPNVSLNDGADARYRALIGSTRTITLAGTTQVTTLNQGMALDLSAITLNQSGGAVTVDEASTLHIPVITAGSLVTITSNKMISTGVAGTYLDSLGSWTMVDATLSGTLDVGTELLFTERADHNFTPTATRGILWVKNTAPNTLIFTDDDGTDTTLGAGGAGGATTELDNLGVVAINTSLVSDTDITDNLGTGDVRWKDAWIETLSAGLTATDTLKLRGRDVNGSAYVDILTITSADTPTADLNAIVTIGGNAILDDTSTVSALTTVGAMTSGSLGSGFTDVVVDRGGTGRSTHTAYAVLCGGTTSTAAQQSIASVGTTGQVLTSNDTGALPTFQDAAGGGATALTIIPRSAISNKVVGIDVTQNTNTVMMIGQIIIPFDMVVNHITVHTGNTNTTPGTLDVTLYSEDGATKVIAVTTASISTTEANIKTDVSAVSVSAGVYWIAINTNSTTNLQITVWDSAGEPFSGGNSQLGTGLTGEVVMEGTLTISAGTPPATITIGDITGTLRKTAIIRLDN